MKTTKKELESLVYMLATSAACTAEDAVRYLRKSKEVAASGYYFTAAIDKKWEARYAFARLREYLHASDWRLVLDHARCILQRSRPVKLKEAA